jgi:cell division protein FtsI/penicillin-binding protein 2
MASLAAGTPMPPRAGLNVKLTLDMGIQAIVEDFDQQRFRVGLGSGSTAKLAAGAGGLHGTGGLALARSALALGGRGHGGRGA